MCVCAFRLLSIIIDKLNGHLARSSPTPTPFPLPSQKPFIRPPSCPPLSCRNLSYTHTATAVLLLSLATCCSKNPLRFSSHGCSCCCLNKAGFPLPHTLKHCGVGIGAIGRVWAKDGCLVVGHNGCVRCQHQRCNDQGHQECQQYANDGALPLATALRQGRNHRRLGVHHLGADLRKDGAVVHNPQRLERQHQGCDIVDKACVRKQGASRGRGAW